MLDYGETPRRFFVVDLVVISLVLIPLFVLNGRWGVEANVDAIAAAAPAWQLVENGTLDLTDYAGRNPWFVADSNGRIVSDRPPGLIASAVPGYVLWRQGQFTNGPASLVALLATFGAVLVIWRLSLPLVGRRPAVIGAMVFALGTTTWAISSAQLWPHGVGQLAAVLALSGFASGRYLAAGTASAVAITLRPVAAVYAGATGLVESWRLRDPRIALKYGTISVVGLLLVLAYNRWLFAQWTLRGGYENSLTGGFGGDMDLIGYMRNLWVMFFSWRHGFLVLSPIVLVASIGAIQYRNRIPGWAKAGAIGAVVYLLVHASLNRASGGAEMFYRYPLEALALASVALVAGAKQIHDASSWGRIAVWFSLSVSIGLQFINVFILSCSRGSPTIPSCTLF